MAVSQHWMPFLSTEKGKTMKVKKNHATASQQRLSEFKNTQWKSLGTQGMHWLVQKPADEDLKEWISMNVVDFFNEVSLMAEIATESEQAESYHQPEKGFPAGFAYQWKDPQTGKYTKVSGPEYIGLTMAYIDGLVNDPTVFPQHDDKNEFPPDFFEKTKSVFLKLFRVFAILFGAFMKTMNEMELASELQTSFKHYIFFAVCFDLLPDEKELTPLLDKVNEYRTQYKKAMQERPNPPARLTLMKKNPKKSRGTLDEVEISDPDM